MKGVRFFILSLFCISFLSCKYDLVQPPTTEPDVVLNASDYANTISNPTGLKATHGGCKKVTLTWDILPNAIQYQIFSAETPFDTFIQVAETPDNSNEIEISEKPGETKYYAIKAVNYFGKVSGLSKFVMGSTQAIIVQNFYIAKKTKNLTHQVLYQYHFLLILKKIIPF